MYENYARKILKIFLGTSISYLRAEACLCQERNLPDNPIVLVIQKVCGCLLIQIRVEDANP